MAPARRDEPNEMSFFGDYYRDHKFNPAAWRLRFRRDLKAVRRYAASPSLGRVLSLGCGFGQFELMLAPAAATVTGIDISPEAIGIAERMRDRAQIPNVTFRCQSVHDLDPRDQYDVIICLGFLHHVRPEELEPLLNILHGCLTPRGFLYAQEPNSRGFLRAVGRRLLGARYAALHSPDERELDPRAMRESMRIAGFETVRIGYIDLTLIPALYLMPHVPAWLARLCVALDWLWCHSPLARRASGFNLAAWKRPA